MFVSFKKFLCSTYLKIKHMLISIKGFNEIHLLDSIIYKGQNYFINNMTSWSSDGTRLYDILPETWDEYGKRKGCSVPRSEFKKKLCWWNIKNDLTSHYRWWKIYWYDIDLRKMMDKKR